MNRRLKVFSHANEVCKRKIIGQKETKNYQQARYKVGDLLKESHIRLCSSQKIEQSDKKSELLSFIQEYRLVGEKEIMFYIRMSIEEVQSTSQVVELSEKIRVLLSELPLTVKERHRLLDYTKSFLLLWMRVIQYSIDVSIVLGGFLLVSYLMKQR